MGSSTAAKLHGLSRRRHLLALGLVLMIVIVAGGAQHAFAEGGPSVQVTAPAAGSTLTGIVSVAATATSDIGLNRAEFSSSDAATSDTIHRGTDTTAPYTACFDTTKVPNTTPLTA